MEKPRRRFQSVKLPRGGCRSLPPSSDDDITSTSSRRRRRNNGQGSFGDDADNDDRTIPNDTVCILMSSSAENRTISLLRSFGAVNFEPGALLCCDSSLSVVTVDGPITHSISKESKLQNLLKEFCLQTWYLTDSSKANQHRCCEDFGSHNHLEVLPPSATQQASDYQIGVVSSMCVPLLSLSLKVLKPKSSSTTGDDVRLKACWKRQLIGTSILFSERDGWTTTISMKTPTTEAKEESLPAVELQVTSAVATPQRMATTQPVLFRVFPSTRITIMDDGLPTDGDVEELSSPSSKAISAVKNQLPPTAERLVETMCCLRKGVSVSRSFLLSGPPGMCFCDDS